MFCNVRVWNVGDLVMGNISSNKGHEKNHHGLGAANSHCTGVVVLLVTNML